MKIFLTSSSLAQGGAERVLSELANEFAKSKHEVHVVILTFSEDFYLLHPNIKVHRLGFRNNGLVKRQIDEIKTLLKLRKLFKVEKPETVLSFGTKYNILTILAGSFLNLKIYVSDRSNPNKRVPWRIDILRRLTYRFAAGLIAQTIMAKEIQKRITGNKNIRVIANPVKTIQSFSKIKREKIILNVGRLVPEKGQKYLLEAFKRIDDTEWKLVILGEGPLRNELQEQVRKLEIENSVIMPGAVKNVDEWLAKASIFAFPSVSEGFPNALVEAMVAHLPCVSFDCDEGPRDIINNGVNGFIVRLYNTNELTNRLELLIKNPELRLSLGKKASAIQNELEVSKIANKYFSFFTKNN